MDQQRPKERLQKKKKVLLIVGIFIIIMLAIAVLCGCAFFLLVIKGNGDGSVEKVEVEDLGASEACMNEVYSEYVDSWNKKCGEKEATKVQEGEFKCSLPSKLSMPLDRVMDEGYLKCYKKYGGLEVENLNDCLDWAYAGFLEDWNWECEWVGENLVPPSKSEAMDGKICSLPEDSSKRWAASLDRFETFCYEEF